jgi:hypothetical protein
MLLNNFEYFAVIKQAQEVGKIKEEAIYQITEVKFYAMMPPTQLDEE